ncbi:MAG: hypothetical protein KC777_06020 [Cyanobacteria bacterium HKST-UBA02]|nr:hypothetical protein [Cyanobacteria bacterium HKST-UBA02]
MSELNEILHNIADHTETLHRIIGDQNLETELKRRLVEHIILEEKDNSERLRRLHSGNPRPITQKLLDHSYFLQKMVSSDSMTVELKAELLHHFMEEHQEWQRDLQVDYHAPGPGPATVLAAGSDSPKNESTTSWTVGPMWGQGG